ncbi:MAG: PPC domain-containing protein [Rhodospirillaceae bacterium]|nr:PPC domain-containing protein [Rhodospirillaceae bacterium]
MFDLAKNSSARRAATAVALATAWLFSPPVAMAQSIESTQAPAAVAPDQPGGVLGENAATRLDYRTVAVAIAIDLPAVDDASVEISPEGPRVPLRIGVPLSVPDDHRGDLLRNATWTTLASGARVTSIALHSPGAGRLRVALRAALPDGARVRFFASGHTQPSDYPVYSRKYFESRSADRVDASPDESSGVLWSPIVDGDTLGMEVEVPAGQHVYETHLQIVLTSHIFEEAAVPTAQQQAFVAQSNESCPLVDVACKDLTDFPTKAVTRVVFTSKEGTTSTCSGTVINTHRSEVDNSLDPYLLTAHHCIPTRDEADSAEFDFFYYHDTCDGSDVASEHVTRRLLGAELLVTDPSTDLSLLELRSSLPSGAGLAGWDVNFVGVQDVESEVVSISHPAGEPQKYARGNPAGYRVDGVDELVVDSLNVNWTEGLTLPGSSGGGLWGFDEDDDQWRLIGALSGSPPDESCPTEGITFGRFDYFFVNEAQRYLNPDDPLTDDYGGSFTSATGILLASEIDGEIDHRADADTFRIVVTEPGVLRLSTTGGTNTVGRLLTEDGAVIHADAAGGYLSNFRIAIHVRPGTYYVRVSGWNPDSVGSYRLHTMFTADSERPAAEIALFLAASHTGRQGFIRLLNATDDSGTVEITAFDDDGVRHGPVTVSIDAQQTRHFNSDDLEKGNTSKGLAGLTGPGSGDWRLRFDTDLEIEVASYVRTSDGFLTPMHDAAHVYAVTGSHFVSIFNPGSNRDRLSKLRLVNPDSSREVRVAIIGQDDAGRSGSGTIELTLPPGASRTFDATQLEAGDSELTGRLGDGQGKWRLWVEAEGDIVVLNLLDSVSGHLANLSSPGQIIE